MGFSRQEYWSGLLFPPPEDLHDQGIKPMSLMSLALAEHSLSLAPLTMETSKTCLVVQSLIHVQLFATPWTAACQVSLSFTVSLSWLNSCPFSSWCHPTISSSVVPFSSCLQSFPASGSFPMSCLFASGGQSIGASASASAQVLSVNIQDWFPLGLTGLISLQAKGLSVFSRTTVQKHQFSSTQPSLWSSSQIHTWLLEKA